MRIWPGRPYPLGAQWDGEGVNFAVFSQHADQVDLCLFDQGRNETARIRLKEQTSFVWHIYLPDVRPGQLYGFRVHGAYDPDQGLRFNPHKLLIDPYARAVTSDFKWHDSLFAYQVETGDDTTFDERDSAAFAPLCVVVNPAFPWEDDRPPRTPWNRTVIYECHVKGMTQLHPEVAEEQRGTYLGLASQPVIDHLKALGITAIELLPVHHSLSEHFLHKKGLTNYWGYNTLGFFAPDARFATGDRGQQVDEFRSMVKSFHRAGIEVILDVVYNHTCEASEHGPTLSFRGLDNPSYYRLVPESPRHYIDYAGTGNTVTTLHPRSLQLVLDSLRYWVEEMHVDGFRFDLAAALGRDPEHFSSNSRFFSTVQQDPVLSRVKLIAEPWDVGPEGYQVGGFPNGWSEWNGKYRDNIRAFWRSDSDQLRELAYRLSGSSDLYENASRHVQASVNFVTSHDGFTLRDLVTYEQKRNEANGEENRDGDGHNLSRNWGVEGETDDAEVNSLRRRAMRNFLATLAFSQGVPMLTAGDEFARTQGGNNNAYAQDNETSWISWDLDEDALELLKFTQHVFSLRATNPALRRRTFFTGGPVPGRVSLDVVWIRRDGAPMSDIDWQEPDQRVLGMLIQGRATDEVDEQGRPLTGSTVLLMLNGGMAPTRFTIPELDDPGYWEEAVNTSRLATRAILSTKAVNLVAHGLILLIHRRE